MRYATILCMVLALFTTTSSAFLNPKFPQAGGLELYINYDPLEDLMNSKFWQYHGYDWIKNITFDIDYKFDKFAPLFDFELNSITTNDIKWKKIGMEYHGDKPSKHTNKFTDLNMTLNMDCSLKIFGLLDIKITEIGFKGVNFQQRGYFVNTDEVNWRYLHDHQLQKVDSVILKVNHPVMQAVIDEYQWLLVNLTTGNLDPFVSTIVNGMIDDFNMKIWTQQADTWLYDLPYFSRPINLTQSMAVQQEPRQHLLSFYTDAHFEDIHNEMPDYPVQRPQLFPPQYWESHGITGWIHESMVNSALMGIDVDALFPIYIDDQDICAQFVQLFPEVTHKYSKNMTYQLELSAKVHDNQAVQFSKEHGIQIGQHGSIDLFLGLNVEGTNSNDGNDVAETAFKLGMNPGFHLDLLVRNYTAHVELDNIQIQNADLVENNAGVYHRDYDVLFTNLIQLQVDSMLNGYGDAGIPLIQDKQMNNIFNKYFSNTTVTTGQFDEFLYLGMTPHK